MKGGQVKGQIRRLPTAAGASRRPVGVLALQGDVREHVRVLAQLGETAAEVRTPADLAGVRALVMPGGESTTMSILLESSGLVEPLRGRLQEGMPALGTCAGMILLASEVVDGRPDQQCLGAIDIGVRRNAFGRQVDSFEADLERSGPRQTIPRGLHSSPAGREGGGGRRGPRDS